MRPTKAEIDLGAFVHNIGQLRRLLDRNVKLMAVLKADGYGHGAAVLAQAAQKTGVDIFGVACAEEASDLRQKGISSSIVILGAVGEDDVGEVIGQDLSVALFSPHIAKCLNDAARAGGKKISVHLKIDTGMHRLGLRPEEALSFLDYICGLKNLNPEAIFTHFAQAENDAAEFTDRQMEVFSRLLAHLRGKGAQFSMVHAANSAAIINYPKSHFSLVRPGIALYGSNPCPGRSSKLALRNVLTLKTKIVHIESIARGESVSYGCTFLAARDSIIAVIPIGYADGYGRRLSNKAEALVGGKRVKVAGMVCMDMTMLDITDVPGARVNDEVVLLGPQGKETISAEEMAAHAETIPYEVFCQIGRRVPREYWWPDNLKS